MHADQLSPNPRSNANGVACADLLGVVLFVYSRGGTIRCLTQKESSAGICSLENGWHHTATINAARWIDYLVNDAPDPFEQFDDLRRIPPNAYSPASAV
jgi:hypothetical protein